MLTPLLAAHGFRFEGVSAGKASGGRYAEWAFRKDDRRLELHYRYSLGLVRYHADAVSASHAAYMKTLGVEDRCQYPGYPDDQLDGFRHLLHDLQHFGEAFLRGDTEALVRAAQQETGEAAAEQAQQAVANVGDTRRRTEARALFKQKRYAEALVLWNAVVYPDLLSEAERKMMRLGRRKSE